LFGGIHAFPCRERRRKEGGGKGGREGSKQDEQAGIDRDRETKAATRSRGDEIEPDTNIERHGEVKEGRREGGREGRSTYQWLISKYQYCPPSCLIHSFISLWKRHSRRYNSSAAYA